MFEIKGTYASAVVYSDTAEDYAKAQIQMICDNEAAAGSKIAVMPDVHPGKVGPIGLAMSIGSKVMPGLVGIDIGCGVSYTYIGEGRVELQRLDKVIREKIPAGFWVRKEQHPYSDDFDFGSLLCRKHINEEKARLSLGTLGGGNHFLELDRDDEGNFYIFVHSGSRRLGKEVTEFYLREGQRQLKKQGIQCPYELTWLEGELMADYIHDLEQAQGFAMLNREIILSELRKAMKWKELSFGESVHNYVDEDGILRKGAASARAGDEVIIPVNMRDGVILGEGKGNPDWNFSAPHGAGRVLARQEVKRQHTVSEFKKAMEDIYSTSVGADTLDEAPFAYRDINEILEAVKETVSVKKILKPVYNFKAGDGK